MANLNICSLESDGERRDFAAHGHAIIGDAGAVSMTRGTFEPGWRWSKDVAPVVGTETCQARHHMYIVSGTMHLHMDDGTESTLRAGDVVDIPAGHDAWVEGEEPCVTIDVSPESTRYAVGRPTDIAAPDDHHMGLVRKGYDAFNTGDVDVLLSLFASDVVVHVPGSGPLAGTYKGPEAVLGYYGKLAELHDGAFNAFLMDVHGDGYGHVMAQHQTRAMRNGVKRVARGSILFSFVGDKVHDMLELHGDLPGDDAFMS